MSGSEHARPVWLTREQRDEIDIQGFEPEIVAAWDAAPADPAKAVRVVLDQRFGYAQTWHVEAVLRAVGHPKEPA